MRLQTNPAPPLTLKLKSNRLYLMKAYFPTIVLLGLALFITPSFSFSQCSFDVPAMIQPTVDGNIYCTYDTITLSTPDTFETYQWYYNFSNSNQGGTPINGATTQNYTTTAGEFGFVYFYLEGTKDNCTEASSTILIDTWAFLSPVVISFPQPQFCRGDSTVIAIGSGLWENIQWSKDNVPIPGATDSTFWVKESGTYVVFASPSICPETELTSGLGPTFTFEGPEIPEISQDLASLVSTSGPDYQWYLAGQPISGATSQNYTPEASGEYTVEVSDGSGCNVFSQPYSFMLSTDELPLLAEAIQLFPNPVIDQVILRNLPPDVSQVELLDASGRTIRWSNTERPREWSEDLSDLESGVYFFRLWQNDGFVHQRFIKQ